MTVKSFIAPLSFLEVRPVLVKQDRGDLSIVLVRVHEALVVFVNTVHQVPQVVRHLRQVLIYELLHHLRERFLILRVHEVQVLD